MRAGFQCARGRGVFRRGPRRDCAPRTRVCSRFPLMSREFPQTVAVFELAFGQPSALSIVFAVWLTFFPFCAGRKRVDLWWTVGDTG